MSIKKVVLGTALISAARVLRLLAQFVAIPLLSRLLSPADYGLVAIAMPFALFGMMLADAGIGMSLVRTPADQRLAWSSAFWVSTGVGLVMAVCMIGLAHLVAWTFGEPSLTLMISALAFLVLAQAAHLIPVAALQQEQRFGAIALMDVVSTAAGIGTALYMALHGAGAWALIGQQIAYFAVRVVMTFMLSPFRPLMNFDWHQVREHVIFGRGVLANSLVNYAARSVDNWIVGKMLGATVVGFYSMAFQFARLPSQLVTGPFQYALYSQLAKPGNGNDLIARAFLVSTRVLAHAVFSFMAVFALAAEPVFAFLLSGKWRDAGFIFMILAPACALQTVTSIGDTILYARGRTDVQLRASSEYGVLWLVVLFAAVSFGLTWTAIVFSVCTVAYQWRYLSMVLSVLGLNRSTYARACAPALVTALVGAIVYALLAWLIPGSDAWHFVLALVTASASFGLGLLVVDREMLSEFKRLRSA